VRSPSAADNARRQAERKQVRQLEQRLAKLAEERERVLAAMVTAASDPERLMALQDELVTVDASIHEVEDTWLELTVG
jgi:ATP-binding cassette subfamily F protein uup